MKEEQKRGRRKVSALVAASYGRSATAAVRHHTHASFDMTGTNVSYEGATAPGAGGSMGTGYSSGKGAVDGSIRSTSDYEILGRKHVKNKDAEDKGADWDLSGRC